MKYALAFNVVATLFNLWTYSYTGSTISLYCALVSSSCSFLILYVVTV
jgi:hypothetical protein